MESPQVSDDDKKKIDKIMETQCHLHDIDVQTEEIKNFIDLFVERINSAYWLFNYRPTTMCDFCGGLSEYVNSDLDMVACVSCYSDIEYEEVDVFDPGDHPVSNKIRNVFCHFIDEQHCASLLHKQYFNDYRFSCNICCICHEIMRQNLTHDHAAQLDYARVTSDYHIAHRNCFEEHGFRKFRTKEFHDKIIESWLSDALLNALAGYDLRNASF